MCSQQKKFNKLLKLTKLKALFAFNILGVAIFCSNASALEIHYDSQLDDYVHQMANPLLKNTSLTDVKFLLIKSDQINAFATPNKEIALYSGLIEKSTAKSQVQGVLAHELGHLIANHHVKTELKNQNTGLAGIAGTVFGVGAVIAGAPNVGMAAILGGASADVSKQLAYSREHENEADSIAISLLKKSDISVQGLADFFKVLQRQERLYFKARPEFLNTHPATSRRKSFMQNNLVKQETEVLDEDFEVFKAKLYALTNNYQKTLNKYNLTVDSKAKFLALSVGYMNAGDFSSSLVNLQKSKDLGLKDVWYFDMLGQINYQESKFEESILNYLKSKDLGNNSWILDFQIAESYFAKSDKKALDYYFKALLKYDDFYYTLKRISDFYAKFEQVTKAHLYLAKYYLKLENSDLAKQHIMLAKSFYKKELLTDEVLKFEIDEIADQLSEKNKKS